MICDTQFIKQQQQNHSSRWKNYRQSVTVIKSEGH